ncbi:hypothetical protein DB29_00885 [Shouchella clausii]|nr:hypothetical protein DB29_00885 [Shouchella clausii]
MFSSMIEIIPFNEMKAILFIVLSLLQESPIKLNFNKALSTSLEIHPLKVLLN